ncbi:MAG TPA: hypothetical protein VFE63_06830 [Roseiarcus sp.]|nr:hypothetical protein [Roseiarcus sp.]
MTVEPKQKPPLRGPFQPLAGASAEERIAAAAEYAAAQLGFIARALERMERRSAELPEPGSTADVLRRTLPPRKP